MPRLNDMEQNGWALEYVPQKLRDKEMCMEAVKQDEMIMIIIPEKFKDNKTKDKSLATVEKTKAICKLKLETQNQTGLNHPYWMT